MKQFTSGARAADDRKSNLPRRQASRAASLHIFATLAGRTLTPSADHASEDEPRAVPVPYTVSTAWVLSSGGPPGLVRVGVPRALGELRLTPDLMVGASVGTLIGGLRAAGRSAACSALFKVIGTQARQGEAQLLGGIRRAEQVALASTMDRLILALREPPALAGSQPAAFDALQPPGTAGVGFGH